MQVIKVKGLNNPRTQSWTFIMGWVKYTGFTQKFKISLKVLLDFYLGWIFYQMLGIDHTVKNVLLPDEI